jgi:uncharacterized protein (TIGR03067 family)
MKVHVVKRPIGSVWIGLVVIAAAAQAAELAAEFDADDTQERKDLAGVWRGFTVEGKGEKPDQGPYKLELTFTDKAIHGIEFKGETPVDHGAGAFVLDLAAMPRQLDGVKTNERGRKESWLGIYKREGDTLFWCVGRRERPETFETVKGQFLLILKRGK